MERIAVISDIHGNLEALTTCLADIRRRGITRIFCLGDIVGKGIHAKECVDLVLENCEVVVTGNLEVFVNEPTNPNDERQVFFTSQLDKERLDKLAALDFCYEMYISGSFVRMFHASPHGVRDRISEIGRQGDMLRAFLPSDKTISRKNADIAIYGDIHVQLMRKFHNKTLINCGSVGCATDVIRDENFDSDDMETTQVFYLIIEGAVGATEYGAPLEFNFVRIPYDIDKELEGLDRIIEPESYYNELKKGQYRDAHRLKDGYNITDQNNPA
ncbi:MAG: metallophosphatase family protein [Candidatus Nomurabacteria bacterium]|nr:metallophosphatase family protein [Candidatus Nomurabacteria bacterium]